uniref:Si:dkey-19b23.7 n=1 Tax=Neogobius melanostomus TaxID=47308 RepID=A0A8C6UDP5_9GOBI
ASLSGRRLQHFLADLALLGSLQGFKYFQPWLRGKEELLLTIVNEDLVSFNTQTGAQDHPPYAYVSTIVRHDIRGGPCRISPEPHLPPAAVAVTAVRPPPEVNCTLFLVAGYVKYGRPYAWIRSNHERLVKIGGTDSLVKDTPMKLKSISDWQTRGIRVWDIVNELVSLCTVPSPANPFALDLRYIKSLPLPDRFLVTGALLNFLEMYIVYGNRDEMHYDKVVEEVKSLRRLHIRSLLEVQQQKEGSRLTTSPTALDSPLEDQPTLLNHH